MKKIFFCLLLVNFQNLCAQEVTWFEGSLVLSNTNVLIGEIAIEPDHDLILFQQNGSRMVYPAHRIKSLYFFDKAANINRRYVSLLQFDDDIHTRYKLYEIVVSGKVSVLRRKKANAFSIYADALDFNYFTQFNGVLTPLRKFNRKIFHQLLSHADKRLEDFISTNRLTANNALNAMRIIEFYNSLVKSDESLAKN